MSAFAENCLGVIQLVRPQNFPKNKHFLPSDTHTWMIPSNYGNKVEEDYIQRAFIERKYKTKRQTKVRAYNQPKMRLSSIKCIR